VAKVCKFSLFYCCCLGCFGFCYRDSFFISL